MVSCEVKVYFGLVYGLVCDLNNVLSFVIKVLGFIWRYCLKMEYFRVLFERGSWELLKDSS